MTTKTDKKDPKNPEVFGRTEFFKLPEPEVKKVFIEVINASVYCKKMNAKDQSSYEFSMMEFTVGGETVEAPKADLKNLKCKYLVRVLCNSKGIRLFKDDEADVIGQKETQTINGIHKGVADVLGDTKEVEKELEKNSVTTPQED